MEPRHRELLEEMTRAIGGAVAGGRVGIAFSGGVDSTLMAKICADLGYGVTLLTIGFAGSHDVGFAREVNRHLGLPHHTLEIPPESFGRVSADIREMVGGCSLSWIENCIAFHYVSELARTLDISVVVTANGIDELFCGYNAYRETMAEGEQAVLRMMDTKIANEVRMMEVVNAVSARNSTRIVQPLLSADFVGYAREIPIKYKITGSDDLMRKHIVRELAQSVGVPELSAKKRKKALQYGSAIHKALIKSM